MDDDEDNNTQFEDSPQLVATTQQIRHLVEHLEYDCGIVEQENQHLQLQCDELNAKLKDLERKHHALQAQYVREMLSKIRPKRLENIEEHQEVHLRHIYRCQSTNIEQANINNAEPQSVDNVGNEQTEEVTRS